MFVDLLPHLQKLASSLNLVCLYLDLNAAFCVASGLSKLIVFIAILVHLVSAAVPPVFLQYFDRTALADASFQ